jgi:hypothetical protein
MKLGLSLRNLRCGCVCHCCVENEDGNSEVSKEDPFRDGQEQDDRNEEKDFDEGRGTQEENASQEEGKGSNHPKSVTWSDESVLEECNATHCGRVSSQECSQ